MNKIEIIALLFFFSCNNYPDHKWVVSHTPSGALQESCYVNKHGQYDGFCYQYVMGGKLFRIMTYKNDTIEGKCYWFREDSSIYQIDNYKGNKLNDTSIFLNRKNEIFKYQIYKDDYKIVEIPVLGVDTIIW